MTFPSYESLHLIYNAILSGHLQPFKKGTGCVGLAIYIYAHGLQTTKTLNTMYVLK